MPSLLRHTYILALLALASGCGMVYDDGPDGPEPDPVLRPRPEYITLRVEAPSASRAGEAADPAAPGFEKGSELENFIDFDGGDYRLYLFTEDDDAVNDYGGQFIAQLPSITSVTEGETTINSVPTVTYTVNALLPEAARDKTQFRVVFLANWHNYPTADELAGKSLAYLTEMASSTFDALTTPAAADGWLSTAAADGSPKRLIPFYGVRSYSGFGDKTTTEKNEDGTSVTHTLDLTTEPLPLLRAMAKVELIVSPSIDFTLSEVKVSRHNPKGFCAPANAFLHTDYFNNYTYATDFTATPHIPAGMTDAGELAFTKAADRATAADGTVTPERWVAYMPEYVNIGSDTPAEIHLKVSGYDQTAKVYFAKYPNGTIDNTDENRYDLLRNNIYRITITDLNINSVNGTIVAVPWTYKSLPEIIL